MRLTELFGLHAKVQAGAPFSVKISAQSYDFVNLTNKHSKHDMPEEVRGMNKDR